MLRLKLLSLFATLLVLSACASSRSEIDAVYGETGAPASIPSNQSDFVQNVGDRVFFQTDQSSLSVDAKQVLDRQAVWMNQFPEKKLTIEGHADERGTREYNLALGERRATAVRNYLISKGVPANRLSTISYGKERPEVLGSTLEAWSRNRRAVGIPMQ